LGEDFIRTPCSGLGGEIPRAILQSPGGIERVHKYVIEALKAHWALEVRPPTHGMFHRLPYKNN
jgi:hypothetical protein